MKTALWWASGALGSFLMIINFWGLYQGANIWPKPEKIYKSKNHEPFSRENFRIERKPGEADFDYAKRMTLYVHSHTNYYFAYRNSLGNIDVMVAPFAWCWPLWLRGAWAVCTGNKFSVEFCNAEKALERGYGFCSQRALILQDILRRDGMSARARDLYGHVVCTAIIDGREVVLDPDYGFASSHELGDFHEYPELLFAYMDYGLFPKYRYISSVYRKGAWIGNRDGKYACKSDFELFWWRVIQWGLPLLFIYFSLNGLIVRRKNTARHPQCANPGQ